MNKQKPDDHYFATLDAEKKEKLRTELEAEQAKQEFEERKKLHYHRCGKCGSAMGSHAFRGVEIEICPECGSVLLDKGELETLAGTDRSGALAGIVELFQRKT